MRLLSYTLFILCLLAALSACEKDSTSRKQVFGRMVDSNNNGTVVKQYVLHVLTGDTRSAARSAVAYYFLTDSSGNFRVTFAEVEPSTLSVTYKDEQAYTGKSLWKHPIDFDTELDAGVIKEQ